MKTTLAFGLALALYATSFGAASAARQCGPHDKLSEVLGKQFQESRHGLGVASAFAVVELFVSAQGTWTMTSTTTDGLTCIIAAGEGWQQQSQTPVGLES